MNKDELKTLPDSGDGLICGVQQQDTRPGEVDVAALLRVIWRRKLWIVAATLLCTLSAIGYALVATEWYRAEAVLLPRDSGSSSGLAGQLAQMGGFASMAGITLGQTSKQEPLGVLRSVGFARRFVEQNDLVSALAEEVGDNNLRRGTPERRIQQTVEVFRSSIMSITEDKKTGLILVAIEWTDPIVAATWANAVPRQLNKEMRQRALTEGTRNVQYLKDQLARTETVSLQQAIARIIESEMQKLMLAEGADEYAFRVIDDAQPPAKRARPHRAMLVVVTFLASLLASLLLAILIDPCRAVLQEVRAGR